MSASLVGLRVLRTTGDGRVLAGLVTELRYGLWRVRWDNGTVSSHHRNELKLEVAGDGE